MTYVKTTLQHSIDIDAIITLHYFEYMKNFEFKGESHNFWEFLYVDKGTVAVRADDTWTTLYTGDIIFHQPNEFRFVRKGLRWKNCSGRENWNWKKREKTGIRS